MSDARPDTATLEELERLAAEFARLAGAEIVAALGRAVSVSYKGEAAAAGGEGALRDPVTEVDHDVEVLVRARLAERHPEHDVIGEEVDHRPGRDHDYVWAIDPVDGTTNFVNGFPLFAASVGVLHRGRPVAGALWCSTSHRLTAGVYHARAGGSLCFDGQPVEPPANPGLRRRLVGLPQAAGGGSYDVRKTGSAAIECAFVAAGLMAAARFAAPNLWDVAGGAALVEAAGGIVLVETAGAWAPLERFEADDLGRWQHSVVIGGTEEAARALLPGAD